MPHREHKCIYRISTLKRNFTIIFTFYQICHSSILFKNQPIIMKKIALLCLCISFLANAYTQTDLPELNLLKSELEAHMRFLASDELQGRRTGEAGIEIAARYIASQWQALGVQAANDGSYMQAVDLQEVNPMEEATFTWNKTDFTQGNNLMMLTGDDLNVDTKAVFANHGWVDKAAGINDYDGLDVEGKIVVTLSGKADDNSPMATFTSIRAKRDFAKEHGAIAVIEVFKMNPSFWKRAVGYFSKSRLEIATPEGGAAYGWVLPSDSGIAKDLKAGKKKKVSLKTGKAQITKIPADNIVGIIEGSDPALKEEYVLLSAHYDHVGTGKKGGGAFTAQDSIFNGARDNAIGTVALLAASKVFSQTPPKRSVILLACTAEEVGLLGSRYYADNPLVPLKQTIFNLNCDGGGYNDTGAVAVIGLDRVGAKQEILDGAAAFDLKVIGDPAPEQGLFDRSDNVSFASKGIPAPNFAPGMSDFNEEIMKYYHQVADNPDTIDYDYLHKFCQAYVHTARLIANKDKLPFWATGDKYEAAGKALYNKE